MSHYKKICVLNYFWLSTVSELRSYLRAILVRSVLQRWYSTYKLLSFFVNLVYWGSSRKFVFWPTSFWQSAISELRSYLRVILARSLLQRWYSNSQLLQLSYFVNLVYWGSSRKFVLWPTNFWQSAISELRSYLRAIRVRSLLQRWCSNSELLLLSYLVNLVLWAITGKLVFGPANFWLNAISELRRYLRAIRVRPLLQMW